VEHGLFRKAEGVVEAAAVEPFRSDRPREDADVGSASESADGRGNSSGPVNKEG
jgi:hypothetical protein